ncbi:MAG: type VI secretion system contractile sheath large subunit [Pyrinomonadaceae bacterium]
MPIQSSIGDFDLNLSVDTDESVRAGVRREPETPFRIAVLGNLGGHKQSDEPFSKRRFVRLDQDNFDAVMVKIGAHLSLHLSRANDELAIKLTFESLEDFHPDHIYERVELFEKLRITRKDLQHPQKAAAEEVRSWWDNVQTPPVAPQSAPEDSATEVFVSGSLLDQMLAATEKKKKSRSGIDEERQSQHPAELTAFLRRIVEPHVSPKMDDDHEALIGAVDAAISQLMREILHHPEFQSLEAAWRSLYFLVSRLELNSELQLHVLDISQEELASDLLRAADVRATGIYKLLVEETVETPGGTPWAVVVGDYAFGSSDEDLNVLRRMGDIARRMSAPFIAGAKSQLLGCESLAETPDPEDWQQPEDHGNESWVLLRRSLPDAAYLGLALPRFLLRLPYGAETEEAELFSFEEMPAVAAADSQHNAYLWGNASFACAYLLGAAFTSAGWSARPGAILDIEDLPLHVYQEDGGSSIKPCAETTLSERVAETILERGLMPLLSFRDQDKVRLARFQSLADPPTRLAGLWD